MKVIKVISERKYAAGYVVRKELWDHGDLEPSEMTTAYTPDGDYIGDTKWAYRLCNIRGIKPEKLRSDSNICSIGFCEREQKWYGWSHRAIYGFGIGSEIKRGDCGYVPIDKEDFLLDMVRFWTEEDHLDISGEHVLEDGKGGVRVSWTYSDKIKNEKLRSKISSSFQPYLDKWGKGEWTAITLDDAKEMASNFASGVS